MTSASGCHSLMRSPAWARRASPASARMVGSGLAERSMRVPTAQPVRLAPKSKATKLRSEEHTSELQSQSNLVCRLLLEKKNTIHIPNRELVAFEQDHDDDTRH